MDMKGAYLNGTLREKFYMQQPKGFGNRTKHVCQLLKTLYGLKQSGREWNLKLDHKMHKHGFMCLRADPCIYIWQWNNEVSIVTIWVDDLLLFALSAITMKDMKDDIHTEWEVTDLGKLTKIDGIEITWHEDSITIFQKWYIETILESEDLQRVNQVRTPLEHNMPLGPNLEGMIGNSSNLFAQLLRAL